MARTVGRKIRPGERRLLGHEPCSVIPDTRDGSLGDTELSHENHLLQYALAVANESRLFFGELCAAIQNSVFWRIAATIFSVLHVLLVSAQFQVLRVAARWIVASVTNRKTYRYRSKCQSVGYPVGFQVLFTSATSYTTIPESVLRAGPFPAPGLSFQHTRPKLNVVHVRLIPRVVNS